VLRRHLAACLTTLNQLPEALEECNQALEEAPEFAELYRTRAFVRAALRQTDGLTDDLQQFELLSHVLPRAFWSTLRPAWTEQAAQSGRAGGHVLGFPASLTLETRWSDGAAELDGQSKTSPTSADEIDARAELASQIRLAGDLDLAAAEFGKILILDPDYIAVRMTRALLAIETRRFEEAKRDLDLVLSHPGLAGYLRKDPRFIRSFLSASRELSGCGRVEEGRAIARRAMNSMNVDDGDIAARMSRALLAIESQQFEEAKRDLGAVFDQPGLNAYLRKDPQFARCFHEAAQGYSQSGKVEEAQQIARRALDVTQGRRDRRASD
jgi:tetratricopeptide (TPR) repeat protein